MGMGSVRRITERVARPFAGCRVDREAGVIYGALICGPESANNRGYGRESFGDGTQYAGRHVYLNHSRDRRERQAESKIGWFGESIRFRPNGMPEGDFHVLKSHPMAEAVLEAAERNPTLFGFSHVAMCRTSPGPGGRERVESVQEVESIDLVAEPATTKGLFESKGDRPVVTFSQLAECITRHPKSTTRQITAAKWLGEQMGDMGLADAPAADAPPPEEADSGETVTAAFEAACVAIIRDALAKGADKKSVLKRIGKLIDGHADAQDDGGGSEPESESEPSEEPEKKESRPAPADVIREAIDVCRKVGWKGFDADDLEHLGNARPELRESLARRLMGTQPAAGAEKPESGSRHQTAKLDRRAESKAGAAAPKPGDREAFKKWVTE